MLLGVGLHLKFASFSGCTYTVLHVIRVFLFETMKTNVTVRIDANLAHEAKVLAARRGTSLSRLLAEKLEEIVQHERTYEAAMRQALTLMDKGIATGWQKPANRDELHDRSR